MENISMGMGYAPVGVQNYLRQTYGTMPEWASKGLMTPDESYQKVLDSYQSSLPDTSGLQGSLQAKIMASLDNPGMSDQEIESIINKGTDEINESERAGTQALTEASLAAGGGNVGGDYKAGLRDTVTNFAGQRASQARDTRLAAAQQKQQNQYQAMNAAGSYLGQQQQQRNRMLDFMAKGPPGMAGAGGGGGGESWHIGSGGGISGEEQNRQRAADRASGNYAYAPGSNIGIPIKK